MKEFLRHRKRRKRSQGRSNNGTLSFVPCFDDSESSQRKAIEFFRKYQILHIRPKVEAKVDIKNFQLHDMFERFPNELAATFSCENNGTVEMPIALESVFDSSKNVSRPKGSWYASAILQPLPGGNHDDESRMQKSIEDYLPIPKPNLLSSLNDAIQSLPVWLFVGQHQPANRSGNPLRGRPEHTDSITSTGTWHFQICGSKIWMLRPFTESKDWQGCAPRLKKAAGSIKALREKWSKCSGAYLGDNRVRCRIECQQGDLLFVNTRLWWHATQLPETLTFPDGLSISYARDFVCPSLELPGNNRNNADIEETRMTNVDGVYASRNVRRGDIVLTEDELPNCALPESRNPNCEVVELEDGSGALIAIHDLSAGDWLTVAYSDDEESRDEE